MNRRRLWTCLALASLLAAAPAAHAAVRVTANPPLTPAFSPRVLDYVSRCSPSVPLILDVRSGTKRVRVDGGRRRHGSFRITRRLRDGQKVSLRIGTRTYRIRCISPKFPAWTSTRSGTPQAQWFVVTPSTIGQPNGHLQRYVAIVNDDGVPVWWMRPKIRPIDAKLLPNGHIAWERFFGGALGVDPTGAYEEHRLDGRRVRTARTRGGPTDLHDSQRLANGHTMLITYVPRDGVDLTPYGGPANATVLDCEVQEIDRRGHKLWWWSTKDHIPLSETDRPWWRSILAAPVKLKDGRSAYDPVHLNSVDARKRDVIVSLRHADAVYDIARPSGRVLWKLGGTQRPESLALQGTGEDAATIFGGQHDARLISDGTLTVHDNGTTRARRPRALRFRIDAAAGAATLLESVSDTQNESSAFGGSARKLPGGDWLASWGGLPTVEELTPAGAPVFSLTFQPQWLSYRVFPVPRGELSRATLNHAMERMHGSG